MSRAALFGIMLIIGIHAFDELVLVISLPEIARQLSIGHYYGLTIAAYILAAIAGMSASGAYIDSLGPRKVLNVGLLFFFIGMIQATVAWNGLVFIFARVLQGLGGGIIVTCAFALINLLSTPETKSKSITAIDIAWVIPSLSAPMLGGFIVEHLSWRWIFIAQMPIVILIAILISPHIKQLDVANAMPSKVILIDSTRIACGMGVFFLVLAYPIGLLWLLLLPAIVIAIPAYNRVMPEQWFLGASKLSLPILVGMLCFVSFYGLEAFQPLYLIEELGLSTIHAGLIVTSASASWLVGSHSATLLYKRISSISVMLLGNVLLFLGIASLGIVTYQDFAVIYYYPAWAIAGMGMGFCFNAVRTSAMQNTPKNQEGFVATAITLSVNMGIGISAGAGGAIKNRITELEQSTAMVLIAMVIIGLVVCMFNIALMTYRKSKFE